MSENLSSKEIDDNTNAVSSKRDDPLSGILWMLLSCAVIAGIATLGRYVTLEGVPPFQVVFLRLVFAMLTMLPILMWRGLEFVKTEQIKTYSIRTIVSMIAMLTWFSALAEIPVGKMTAISFITPLIATVFAALLLKERIRLRRWIAMVIGLLGALVILRPGIIEITNGVWLAIISAICMGFSVSYIKRLTSMDDPDKVVFITTLMMTPVALLPALYVWEWPPAHVWIALIAMGPVATVGHITLARAMAATEASLVMSVDFARLPFAVLYGFVLFGEVVDLWTWFGASIIFIAGFYIARREAFLKKQPKPITRQPID